MPKEVRKVMLATMSAQAINRGTTVMGMHIVKKLLVNALKNEESICGRLYLL